MTVTELFLLLLVAGVCGGVAQALVGVSRGGCLTSIVLGFIGSLLGAWLGRTLQLPEPLALQVGSQTFPILWSIIGASGFVALLTLVTGRTPRDRE